MVKITYDLDNSEDVQMIDDYYFVKYYMKSIRDDWKQYTDIDNKWKYDCEDKDKILRMIINHLNPVEFKRLCKILDDYTILGYDKEIGAIEIVLIEYGFLGWYKNKIIEKFNIE